MDENNSEDHSHESQNGLKEQDEKMNPIGTAESKGEAIGKKEVVDPTTIIPSLKRLLELSQENPHRLLDWINLIREKKAQGKVQESEQELEQEKEPKLLLALSDFVYPKDQQLKRGFFEYLLLDDYSWKYATPSLFGEHRAKKIAELYPEPSVADLSCGSGSQLLELCRQDLKVMGIEKDELRFLLAKINANLALHLGYITFRPEICFGDALSEQSINLVSRFSVLLCDSWRDEGGYSPELKALSQAYPRKYLVYEFRPLENVDNLFQEYPLLVANSEVEFYGEGDRCSRLTAYLGKGNNIIFYQEDENLSAQLSYTHGRRESLMLQGQQNICPDFPSHDFFVVNRSLVENHFASLLSARVFQIDKKRYLMEVSAEKKIISENKAAIPGGNIIIPKKFFSLQLSSKNIEEVSAFLTDNYEDYVVSLRFEIPSEEYWAFVQENNLSSNPKSEHRFSLFRFRGTYHLAEESIRGLKATGSLNRALPAPPLPSLPS